MNFSPKAFFVSVFLAFLHLEAGRFSNNVSRSHTIRSNHASLSVLPSTHCLSKSWKPLGLFEKKELETFIKKPALHELFISWFVLQVKNSTIPWHRFHHHLDEFFLEEEMRSLWGKKAVKTMQDRQIYFALASFLDTFKKEEKCYGLSPAIHNALESLYSWYSPVIDVSTKREEAYEGEPTKEYSYSDNGTYSYYVLDALD